MSFLDDELRKALAPVDPPAGFADRVVARIADAEREVTPAAVRMGRAHWWIAAAAAAIVVVAGTWAAVRSGERPQPVESGTVAVETPKNEPATAKPPAGAPEDPTAPPRVEPPKAPSEHLDLPIKIVRDTTRTRAPRRAVPRRDALTEEEWKAAQQFMLAMSITSEKLKPVQRYLPSTHEGPKT